MRRLGVGSWWAIDFQIAPELLPPMPRGLYRADRQGTTLIAVSDTDQPPSFTFRYETA